MQFITTIKMHSTHKHMTEAYATMTHFCWSAFPLFSWETLIKTEGKCLRESASLLAKKSKPNTYSSGWPNANSTPSFLLFNSNVWRNVQCSIQSKTRWEPIIVFLIRERDSPEVVCNTQSVCCHLLQWAWKRRSHCSKSKTATISRQTPMQIRW